VSLLAWHPTASNVLASVGKEPSVRIWDVEKGACMLKLEGFGGLVQDLSWNYNGSLLATSDKAKMLKVHDPRAGTVVTEWQPHGGGKPFRFCWLGGSGGLVTVGFTAQSKRELKVWDPRGDVSKPLNATELDQAAGVIMPFYDEDTRMLYLAGKGDGNIRYYEMVDGEPYVYPLAEYRTNVSTKGADCLPKRACNAMKCEVSGGRAGNPSDPSGRAARGIDRMRASGSDAAPVVAPPTKGRALTPRNLPHYLPSGGALP
jgi:coronin-1B/1C/6